MRCFRLFCLLSVLLCSVGQALETEPMLQRETQEPVEELLYDGKGLPRLHRYDEEDTAFLSALSSRTVVTRAAGTFSRNRCHHWSKRLAAGRSLPSGGGT